MAVERSPRTIIILDVDQTITGGLVRAHTMLYNTALGLGMTQKELDALDPEITFRKTFDVPQIKQFREKGEDAERRFQEVRGGIRLSKEVHSNFSALPDSQQGVKKLHEEFGSLYYYTGRTREVINPTTSWLESQDFPRPQEVIICASARDKIFKVLRDWILTRGDSGINYLTDDRRVVVIDDNFSALISEAEKLWARYSVMRRAMSGLVLVCFGVNEEQKAEILDENFLSEHVPVRTFALQSWSSQHVKELIGKLKK